MWAWLLSLLTKVPGLLAGPVSQFVTGINVASLLGGVAGFFGSVFKNIKTYWRFYLPVALVASQLGTAYGWYNDHNLLMKERAAHQLDITNFKNAEAAATAQANREKSVLQKESKANADQADAKYSTLLAQYRANLVRYAQQATQSGAGQADHNQLPAASGSDGPSTSSQVPAGGGTAIGATIPITLDDAQVCAVNTARLQSVHDWALNQPKGTQ